MNKIYIVSYDSKDPKYIPEEFYAELARFPGWWHFIDGTWLIRTDLDARGVYARLKPYISEDVNLLIVEAGRDSSGWLPKKAWDWIEKQRGTAAPIKEGSLTG